MEGVLVLGGTQDWEDRVCDRVLRDAPVAVSQLETEPDDGGRVTARATSEEDPMAQTHRCLHGPIGSSAHRLSVRRAQACLPSSRLVSQDKPHDALCARDEQAVLVRLFDAVDAETGRQHEVPEEIGRGERVLEEVELDLDLRRADYRATGTPVVLELHQTKAETNRGPRRAVLEPARDRRVEASRRPFAAEEQRLGLDPDDVDRNRATVDVVRGTEAYDANVASPGSRFAADHARSDQGTRVFEGRAGEEGAGDELRRQKADRLQSKRWNPGFERLGGRRLGWSVLRKFERVGWVRISERKMTCRLLGTPDGLCIVIVEAPRRQRGGGLGSPADQESRRWNGNVRTPPTASERFQRAIGARTVHGTELAKGSGELFVDSVFIRARVCEDAAGDDRTEEIGVEVLGRERRKAFVKVRAPADTATRGHLMPYGEVVRRTTSRGHAPGGRRRAVGEAGDTALHLDGSATIAPIQISRSVDRRSSVTDVDQPSATGIDEPITLLERKPCFIPVMAEAFDGEHVPDADRQQERPQPNLEISTERAAETRPGLSRFQEQRSRLDPLRGQRCDARCEQQEG